MTLKARKDFGVYLTDIRNAILRIEDYTAVGEDTFLTDEKTQDAVIRQISIIGEAASKLPRGSRAKYPEIPWKTIVAMRNILIHEYSDTSIPRVWETVRDDLPVLKQTIEAMLKSYIP